jgi:uncharacterized protein DUF6916
MSVSRRKFLEVGSLVAVSSAVPLEAFSKDNSPFAALWNQPGMHHFTADQARALVNSKFSVEAGLGHPLLLQLDEVTALAEQAGASGEAYVMKFTLARGTAVPQGTYTFSHGATGSFPMFVVHGDSKPASYIATINHRRRS